MSQGMRFVGGSQHGKLIALQRNDTYYSFPCFKSERPMWNPDTPPSRPDFYKETYERRPLEFDGFARIYVMALAGMGQAEFMRRCADVMEGV